MFFWEYPVTGDTAEHAEYGVGPATDFATPIGVLLHAPFAGDVSSYWTLEGGHSARLTGEDFSLIVQHLRWAAVSRAREAFDIFAVSGNSGILTTGPHVHCYIVDNRTGRRMSFNEWVRNFQPFTIDMKGSIPMKFWEIFRNGETGDIGVVTGSETVIATPEEYNKLADIFRLKRRSDRSYPVLPGLDKASNFFNLDRVGWRVLLKFAPVRNGK